MKTVVLIAIAAVLAILIALGAWFLFFSGPSASDNGNQNAGTGNPFPSTGGTGTQGTGSTQTPPSTTVVANDGGQPIETRDFKDDSGVITHPYNTDDYYILVGTEDPAAPNPPYEIDYSDKDQSFGITLYKEPLGQYRATAEQDLMQRLGISEADMCRLNYIVAVGPGVNQAYSGENLEFSFCPNAVALPK